MKVSLAKGKGKRTWFSLYYE